MIYHLGMEDMMKEWKQKKLRGYETSRIKRNEEVKKEWIKKIHS